jgi:hypothetical protein
MRIFVRSGGLTMLSTVALGTPYSLANALTVAPS